MIEKPENRDMVYKPTRLANGKVVPAMAGWQFYNHNGLMDIKGNVSGHSAFLSRFTDASELVCVTLLANKEGVDLTNLGRRIAAAFDSDKMGTGANDNLLYTYESQFSVPETMTRIEQTLHTMGVPVFAKFDHGKTPKKWDYNSAPTRSSFRFTESWHKTDAGQPEYLDRTAAEDLRLGGQERKRMGHVPTDEDDGGRIRAGSRTGNRKDARTTGENRN